MSSEKRELAECSCSIKSHCPQEHTVEVYPALRQSHSSIDFRNVILVAAHTSYLARGSDLCMSFKESCVLNLFIVCQPCKLGTSLRLVSWMQECENLLKTPKQVNKTYKQQVCALIITPLALGAYTTTCWTDVVVNIHSQNVRTVSTKCHKVLHLQI